MALQDLLTLSLRNFDLLNKQIKDILTDVLLVNEVSDIEYLANIWKISEKETNKLLDEYVVLQKKLGLRMAAEG